MTNIMDKIYQEQSLSSSESFIFNYYVKAINKQYQDFLSNEDCINFVEDFFNVRSGDISKILTPQDIKILESTYENLNGEKFKEFEKGKLDFEDCCILKDVSSNSQELSHFLKLHSKIQTAFEEKVKILDKDYENFLSREEYCASALTLTSDNFHTLTLKDKAQKLKQHLQKYVFEDMPLTHSCQEVIGEDFVFFKEAIPEFFAQRAKRELEGLNYAVTLFKNEKESQKEGYDIYFFAYALEQSALKNAKTYFKENYNSNHLSQIENLENNQQRKTQCL